MLLQRELCEDAAISSGNRILGCKKTATRVMATDIEMPPTFSVCLQGESSHWRSWWESTTEWSGFQKSTHRRLYKIRFLARPLGGFFFSCLSTLGVWDLTLPARAREPWTRVAINVRSAGTKSDNDNTPFPISSWDYKSSRAASTTDPPIMQFLLIRFRRIPNWCGATSPYNRPLSFLLAMIRKILKSIFCITLLI